jgi:hypothetical protein
MNATMGLLLCAATGNISNHQIFIPYSSIESHAEAGNVMIALSSLVVMAAVAFLAFIIKAARLNTN